MPPPIRKPTIPTASSNSSSSSTTTTTTTSTNSTLYSPSTSNDPSSSTTTSSSFRLSKYVPLIAAFVVGYLTCSLIMFSTGGSKDGNSHSSSFSSFADSLYGILSSDHDQQTYGSNNPHHRKNINDDIGGNKKKMPIRITPHHHQTSSSTAASQQQQTQHSQYKFISGKESTQHFLSSSSSSNSNSLDLFVVVQDASPRSVLGDLSADLVVSINDEKNRTKNDKKKSNKKNIHLYSVNHEEGGAWWPQSLSGKIREVYSSASTSSSNSLYSHYQTPISLVPSMSKQHFENDDEEEEMSYCTPNKFVGIFGENVKLNSTVLDFLTKSTNKSSSLLNTENHHHHHFGCKIYFTETIDLIQLFKNNNNKEMFTKIIQAHDSFFKITKNPENDFVKVMELLSSSSSSNSGSNSFLNHVPFGFNTVMPQSEFVQLSEFIHHLTTTTLQNSKSFLDSSSIKNVPSSFEILKATTTSSNSFSHSSSSSTTEVSEELSPSQKQIEENINKLHLATSIFFAIRFHHQRYDAGFEHLSTLELIQSSHHHLFGNPNLSSSSTKSKNKNNNNNNHIIKAPHPRILNQKRINDVADGQSEAQRKVIKNIAAALHTFDEDPNSIDIFPVFSTMCVGVDCMVAEDHFDSMRGMGVGYFVFVLNARDPNIHKRFAVYRHAFPGRFILRDPGRKLSCAESWNVILKICFEQLSIHVPFVVIVNADFIITNGRHRVWNSWMRENDNEKLLHYPMVQFHHFYTFAYTKFGWDVVGTFDENVFPAYGEDVEMVYRSVSLNLYPYPEYPDWRPNHRHVGSMSLKDHEVSAQVGRFDRADYNMRKWNIHLYCCGGQWMAASVFQRHRPYPHPFNLKQVPHRNGWVFDSDHRRCIVTGKGQRIHNPGAMCWYNVSKVLDKYPDPEGASPDKLFSRKQLGFAPA